MLGTVRPGQFGRVVLQANSHVENVSSLPSRKVAAVFHLALRERYRARQSRDIQAEERAWKVFGLVPMMLMRRPRGTESVGRDELAKRADDFARSRWIELLQAASETEAQPRHTTVVRSETEDQVRRGQAALSRVRRGQLSRARQELTGVALAPKTLDTLAQFAGETTPRKGDGNPSRGRGLCAGQTFRTGSCTLHQVHRLVARRAQEGAAMRCCECASTIAKCSSCCSEQLRIVHLLPCQKV